MLVDVYNQQNKKVGTTDLPDRIFNVKWNPSLVHQALTVQLANRRQILAHAKGRGEVRGGGKKPWRQKGTGRARHGSTRSPIWRGGGAAHGPVKEKKFAKKINKKMNRLAIFSVLSKKLKEGTVKIVDKFDVAPKTKEWQKVLKGLINLKSAALLIPAPSNNIHRAIKNIKKADAINPKSLSVFDLLKCKNIILEKGAVEEMEKHYL